MQDTPLISVIIPLYNKEETIVSTVNSVLVQVYQNFEVVIVNDGSTDGSLDALTSISDARIHIHTTANSGVSHARNSGVSHARNYGVDNAKGAYVAFLDADDYWYPHHLENIVAMIEDFPTSKWFATAYEIKHNKRLCLPMHSPVMNNGKAWIGEVDDFFANSMQDCLAWTSAVCMAKNFFIELGGFDLALRTMEDTDLWIRAALVCKLVFTSSVSARYILEGDAHISQKNISKKTVMDFDKYEELSSGNASLKAYLDLNRYSVALRYKLDGRNDIAQHYIAKLNLKNLSFVQKVAVSLPSYILKLLHIFKGLSETFSVRLRSN